MRRTLLVVAALAASAACGKSPVGPEPIEVRAPLVKQITATDDNGDIVYICSTKPRQYIDRNGVSTWEVDRYVSKTPCPATPID